MEMRKRTVGLLFFVGLAVVGGVYALIGVGDVVSTITVASPKFIALALAAFILSLLAWTTRWEIYLSRSGHHVPFHNLCGYLVTGLSINAITPIAQVGGEPVRAYLLRENSHVPMRVGLATIASEIVTDQTFSILVAVAALVAALSILPPSSWLVVSLVVVSVVAMVVILSIVGILSDKEIMGRLLDWCLERSETLRKQRMRLEDAVEKFRTQFRKGIYDKRTFALATSASTLQKGFDLLRFHFVFLAVGYEAAPIQLLILMGVYYFTLALPATPGGLGVVEGGTVAALALMGIPLEVAGAAILLDRLISYWLPLLAGAGVGSYYGISLLNRAGKTGVGERI